MFSIIRNSVNQFRQVNKVVVGRFDINTSEREKMIKTILANSDNCGDLICGDPKEVKHIIDKKDDNITHMIK
tara:strand:- start:210 stop:425 length:216 start_codon:yes stop_codon:yes gene_type:complete